LDHVIHVITDMTNLPQDFLAALEQAGLADFFAGLPPSHQGEYLKWIGEAKRPATRAVRIAKSMTLLADKRRKPTAPRRGR
jgi:uncharacterized protein YdeI (YjbR/CyaY-like superfamily)